MSLLVALLAALSSATAPAPTLYLAGDGEAWAVDVAAQVARRAAVPSLRAGDPPFRLVRRGDRLVGWGYATRVLDGRLRARRVLARDSWFFVPAAEDDRVWIAFTRNRRTVRLGELREVAVDGRVTARGVQPPGGQWPLGEVRDGLVFQPPSGLEVWDPRSGRVVRRLAGDHVAALHRDWVATVSEGQDTLRLQSPASLAQQVTEGPGPFVPSAAAFSPDGSRLAIAFERRGGAELALMDTDSGRLTVVRGSRVPPGYVLVTWSRGGEHVFITGGERFRRRVIAAHRVGSSAARRLDVRVGDFYAIAAR